MKILTKILLSALIIATGFQAVMGNEYKNIARTMGKAASARGMHRIAVVDFTAKGSTSKADSEYVAEKISAYLSASEKIDVIERALMDKILGEQRRLNAMDPDVNVGENLAKTLKVDAIITGTVFSSENGMEIISKLIDVKSGKVIRAMESALAQAPAMPSVPNWEAPLPDFYAPPADLRDAVADLPKSPCETKRTELDKLNARAVNTKAKYWAAKMKEPDFSLAKLTRNPGSELRDPEIKKKFYSMISEYHEQQSVPAIGRDEMRALEALFAKEKNVSNDCGLN